MKEIFGAGLAVAVIAASWVWLSLTTDKRPETGAVLKQPEED